ncbi:MAG TPA: hypothetical protein VLH13_01025, partial [Methanomassiliicoccales archaeon]|nr:hypothetical protein [Methanomassiliicoccales archaeon]
ARIVEEFKPAVVLSGHIHEDRGVVEKKGTLYMNPGAAKDGHAGLIDIGRDIQVRLLEKVLD